jgi:hypothetical protein
MQTEQIVALLTAERDRLQQAIDALQGGDQAPAATADEKVLDWVKPGSPRTAVPAPAPKRNMSAAGRKRIADAAKRRWAAIKAAKSEVVAPSEDEEFKSRMSAAMKASWAKRKKALKKSA